MSGIAIAIEDWSVRPYRNDDGSLDIFVKYGDGEYVHALSMEPEITHPDIEWAKGVVRKAKGDRVSEEELDTLIWDGVMKCYLMGWCGMTLGIETDGDMHT